VYYEELEEPAQPTPRSADGVKKLGELIRQVREQHDETQGQLGEVLGHTHAAISDIEKGKTNLTVVDLAKIADHYGVSRVALIEAAYGTTSSPAENYTEPPISIQDSTRPTQPTGTAGLREQILTEFKQVHRLAPADYTENCTNVVMSIINRRFEAALEYDPATEQKLTGLAQVARAGVRIGIRERWFAQTFPKGGQE
jgi:transcriptional regulator with XRE-family HTH domain